MTATRPVSGVLPGGAAPVAQPLPARPARSWPVWVLAAPAFVAVWSGWVGLGKMCGFGPLQLLPGTPLAGWTLDTSITLPIGVETYGAYALKVWLSGHGTPRTVTFARTSAIASLLLGAGGQVAYHLLHAAHQAEAPWVITMVVSALPVLVLGMGAALAHLVNHTPPIPPPAAVAVPDDVPVNEPTADTDDDHPEPLTEPSTGPSAGTFTGRAVEVAKAPGRRAGSTAVARRDRRPLRAGRPVNAGRRDDAAVLEQARAAIADGRLVAAPTGNALRAALGIGAERATRLSEYLAVEASARATPAPQPSPSVTGGPSDTPTRRDFDAPDDSRPDDTSDESSDGAPDGPSDDSVDAPDDTSDGLSDAVTGHGSDSSPDRALALPDGVLAGVVVSR